jgi:multidrug efflux pump subunit AcrA (membrane-fusion protein)
MKRWSIWIIVILAAAAVGGAAYVGLHSTQTDKTAIPQTPATVIVTRGDVQQSVTAPGYLVSAQETVLGARISGRLDALYVRPGDAVQAGDVLAELEIGNLMERVAQAEEALSTAQLRLNEAEKALERQIAQAERALQTAQVRLEETEKANQRQIAEAQRALEVARVRLAQSQQEPDPVAIELLRLSLDQAKNNLWHAQLERDAVKGRSGVPKYMKTQMDIAVGNAEIVVREAELRHQQALQPAATAEEVRLHQIEVERAKAALAELQEGVDPLLTIEIERVRQELAWLKEGVDPLLVNEVEQSQLTLDRLLAQVADAQIVAPTDGIVLEAMVRPGDAVTEGTALILTANLAAVEARTTVIEEDLPLVQVGQTVDLFFDARPDVAIQGRVTHIVPKRESGSDRPLYPVYITPDELPEGLALGMTVDTSIVTASRSDVLRLPRTLVRARPDGTAEVKVWIDGHTEARALLVGLRGDVYVEIVDGLREGEEVVGQ